MVALAQAVAESGAKSVILDGELLGGAFVALYFELDGKDLHSSTYRYHFQGCSFVAARTSLVTVMVMLTGFDWFIVKVPKAGSMFSRPYQRDPLLQQPHH